MKKTDIVVIIITVLLVLGMIAAIIVGVVVKDKDGHENVSPPDTTDQTPPIDNTDTDIPEITPGKKPSEGGEDLPHDDAVIPGDVAIDIIDENKDNEIDNQPHIKGDVSIISGIKEAENEETD